MQGRSDHLVIRFCEKFALDSGGCWEWIGALDTHPISGGYGVMRIDGMSVRTHIVSWELFRGDRTGLCVLHKCDNRRCVNPNHLFLGTRAENIADAVSKKRHAHGERSGHALLRDTDIPQIKQMHRNGMLQKEIAQQFGVSQGSISNIVNNETWKHITGENE